MSVSLRQFFERLPKDGWWPLDFGRIRHGKHWQCPVCVANGNSIHRLAWHKAAAEMGLSTELASRIASAADGMCRTPTEERIRRLLLKHCGLTEPTP